MVRNGTVLLVLSDRNIAKNRLPVPAPMAVGAVQTRLVEKSLRCDANIIVETASARDPHHFAVLLGFGATIIRTWPMKRWRNWSIPKPLRKITAR
jgi:glutamate synthase (NADPH/NADH) large chain